MPEIIRHSSSTLAGEDFSYIKGLARENHVGRGPLCEELEHRLAQRFGRPAAVLTDSGQAALELALHQLQRRAAGRHEVVVSSYVCASVVNAILACGLKPVFADVASGSMNLGIDDVARHRLTQRTLAIVCTHVGGYPDDIVAAAQLGVPVISDCAQAIGSTTAGRSLLAFGEMAIISFGPTKFITAGSGGAILGDEDGCRQVRHSATPELPVAEYQEGGFVRTTGQHFSDLNAGLALAQLERVESFREKRKRIAQRYDKALKVVPGVVLPRQTAAAEPNWFRYYFFSDRATEWQSGLWAGGVDARTSISHVMPDYFPDAGGRPELSGQARRVVSLPIYPGLKAEQVTRIVELLQNVAAPTSEIPSN